MLLLTVVILVNTTPVQNFIVQKASGYMSEKLKTKVQIAHVRLDFLDHILIQGLYIEDQAHDTLLYAGEVEVRINDWFVLRDKAVLHYIGLKNSYIHLYRTNTKSWNYDFIADAFSTDNKKPDNASKPFDVDLKKAELENVRFHMDDKWGGENQDYDIGSLVINARNLDIKKHVLDINNIAAKDPVISINEYKAGHPPYPHAPVSIIDTTPFNSDGWVVKVRQVTVNNATFLLTMDTLKAVPDVFDQDHLIVKDINVTVSNGNITGDTIHGNLENLTAHERCGIIIKQMRSKITVSPNASICENLYLETNYSKIRDYYAMRYTRFPSFLNYIDSVTMIGHLKDATVDMRDIAYFAPQLRKLPNVIARVNGSGRGTVSNLTAKDLSIADGNSVIKGTATLKGLPDIYKTYITVTDGAVLTSGQGILHYAPWLKNNPNVALEQLKYLLFKGNYTGYIENFAVNGTAGTNLGDITANIKLNIPGFNSNAAVYSGIVSSTQFQLGALIRQPVIGPISLKETVAGRTFDPEHMQLDIDGTISQLTLKGYSYKNIITHGTAAKKQFNGTLLVDDPNLALEFDGGIDYRNKNIAINATAHLLGSNFNALHLTTDTVTASADFDLKCDGSSIDDFEGYARLYNLDLRRNSHKLSLDSVEVVSAGDSMGRSVSVRSNALVASIKGKYQLSKLPPSIQYYFSRYLPNYIKAPTKYAPDQDLTFNVTTYAVDSIFAVTVPFIRGFDSSSFTGALNTNDKKLSLSVAVPYGSVGMFHMSNIAVSGQGNFDMLAVNTTIDNVSVGDSALNGSLSVTTSVGNDSVSFTIATTSPDTSSSITLNGQIIARKDSLFLTMFPSQFYLNQNRWDIAGGSRIVYSDKYLLVDGLFLTSGLQKITASTQLQKDDRTISITTQNLDLGQLGSWAGLAAYQPDGRLNGSISIEKIFSGLYINTDLHAAGVIMGADTVGSINIVGSYDGSKKLISLDPQTGIFRNDASVVASGNISFDSTTHQKLDGSITFHNAPVSWASPFLVGILSHLSGTLNGSIGFDGTSYDPLLSGDVTLTNGGMRLDYMGCNYTMPYAKVHVDNKRIEFGTVQLYDAYKNTATLTGHFSHNLFRNMHMHLNISSDKIEIMNLTANDNNLFYGNLIARMDSLTLRGPFNDIKLNVYNASPAAKSRVYIPVSSSGDVGNYSYVSFKTYGKNQDKLVRRNRQKMTINIDASFNDLAEMNIVLDPASGDNISAHGEGHLQMEIPPDNDIRITGNYNIHDGVYTYTFKQLLIIRQFNLLPDSRISFNGPFGATTLDVNAVYSVKARLYDLLSDADKAALVNNDHDLIDAQTPQPVDVNLNMSGNLNDPKLNFDIDLEDKHSQSTTAYRSLTLINGDPQQKFNQVAALLIIKGFIPPDGIGSGTVYSGAINNVGQVLSSSASSGLTAALNRLTGNKQLSVGVTYVNYNNYDQSSIAANRNQVKADVSWNLLHDRLIVELGGTSDWGHPASASTTSTFNLTGDFRIQYLLSNGSPLRLNAFRTSDYDVTLDRDIIRSGVGISWRRTFDDLHEFFLNNKREEQRKAEELKQKQPAADTTTIKSTKTGSTD